MRLDKSDLARFERKLQNARKTDVVEATVNRCGEHLLQESVPLAPKETGDLRGSASSQPYPAPSGPGVEVGYDTEYAFVQHERLDYDHDEGQAKFLEQPYLENKERYEKAIKQAAIKQVRGGR